MPDTAEGSLQLASTAAISGRDSQSEGRGHPRLSLALSVLAGALLLPGFAFVAPQADWTNGLLIATLGAIQICAGLSAIAFRQSFYLNTEVAVGAAAVLLIGSLPAFLIVVVTETLIWCFERERLQASISNLASYGWAAIASSAVFFAVSGDPQLSSLSVASFIGAAVATFVLITVNFIAVALLLPVLLDGKSFLTAGRDFYSAARTQVALASLAMVTAVAVTQIGILALGIFAAITLIPQLLLPILLRPRPVDELSHADAVALYSKAIASVMKLDSTTKEILNDAAHHIEGPEAQANGGKIKASYSGEHFHDVVEAVLYYREHWDSSGGFPGGVGGEMIPLTSRVLAVADNWAQLTATGVWTVTHAQAIAKLQDHAGVEYDPRIVAAAARVVEEERMGLTDNQPQLHEVPLPQLVRKIPRLSGLLAPNRG